MKRLKYLLLILILLLLALFVVAYGALRLSMPQLEGQLVKQGLSENVTLERDKLGTAIITAKNRLDVSYGLGFAHGQDRFFQMDLLRRNAAGELAELFGAPALALDKEHRFHQFRKRAEKILFTLPSDEKAMLLQYTKGVNAALSEQRVHSFEYLLLRKSPRPWEMTDSLLIIFSMYIDLQTKTIERDLVLTLIKQHFGQSMVNFFIQPSQFQAALDLSRIPLMPPEIPILSQDVQLSTRVNAVHEIKESIQKGSNNWAVAGSLTETGQGMLSNDMHLSLGVPIIWYRTQLNYTHETTKQVVRVTGVSLPGAPGVIVGSNGHIAWGFTNAYLDTADWVELTDSEPLTIETERIQLADGSAIDFEFEMSQFGPVVNLMDLLSKNAIAQAVSTINHASLNTPSKNSPSQHAFQDSDSINNNKKYALSWVGYQDYAVNFKVLSLDTLISVEEVMTLAPDIEFPIQNMLVVDTEGNLAWQPTGAFPARLNPSNTAMSSSDYQADLWQQEAEYLPRVINPKHARLWTANARAVSVNDFARLGDGGYALGARNVQIYNKLIAAELFDEHTFYQLQRDNQAHFLQPWQAYLLSQLSSQDDTFKEDIAFIEGWQACACEDSVGYTLVKGFREAILARLFSPIEDKLKPYGLSLSVIKRYLEPGLWQLIKQRPETWLSKGESWNGVILSAYNDSKAALLEQYSDNNKLVDLSWGEVNRLQIQHPFSRIFPILGPFLDMPSTLGFGDNFMPAVQRAHFGASERFIVQPGREEQAILTLPGGQSAHPLSIFYRSGYEDYIHNANTPLLPQPSEYQLILSPE